MHTNLEIVTPRQCPHVLARFLFRVYGYPSPPCRRNDGAIPALGAPFPHPQTRPPRAIPGAIMESFHFLNTISLTDIKIAADRQRQEFDPEAIQELVTSIENNGLMHPPVLRQVGDEYHLVAGERRMRAIKQIFELGGRFVCNEIEFLSDNGLIPYLSLGNLSPLEAEEAELDENLKRRDLTWQELAAAHSRLHALRVRQQQVALDTALEDGTLAGADASEIAQKFPKHTVADTAVELTGRSDGAYQDAVRKELIVAKHLDNPAIAKAKSTDEAFKILKQQEARKQNIELARVVGATFNADKHQLLNVDCLDYMRGLVDSPDEDKFDVICTDPPYGMGAHEFGDGGGKLSGIEHHYDDSYESWQELMAVWCGLSYQVCKPQAHAYVFCDFDRFHELKALMQAAGWYVFRTPLILHKINSGRVPLPDQGPRRQYELILYAIKGKKPVTHIYPDVISASGDDNLSHGAQKPVAVLQNLLQRSVKPGDRVADFFAGAGGIFEAGHSFKCTVVGTELNPEYYAISLKRLQSLKALEAPALL